MSSNSQFQQLRSLVKQQDKRLSDAERTLEELNRTKFAEALMQLERQQSQAKMVAANPDSSLAELENALPHLTSTAWQEQVRHGIEAQQMQQQTEADISNLPNLWDSALIKNIQQGFKDGSYQKWRQWMRGL